MRECPNCERSLPDDQFAVTDRLPWGLEGWCNDCFKAKRQWAWTIFKRETRAGNVPRPLVCSECGGKNKNGAPISGHHLNYHRPLLVVWLCNTCHGRAHRTEEKRVRDQRDRDQELPEYPAR